MKKKTTKIEHILEKIPRTAKYTGIRKPCWDELWHVTYSKTIYGETLDKWIRVTREEALAVLDAMGGH